LEPEYYFAMKELLEALGKALSDFSVRRFVGLIALLGLLSLGTVLYERTTSTLRLNRIEHITTVVERLHHLDSLKVTSDPALGDVEAHLKAELRDAAKSTPPSLLNTGLGPPDLGTAIQRFLSGAMIWMLLAASISAQASSRARKRARGGPAAAVADPTELTKEQTERLSNQAGALGFALGVVSIFLPLQDDWWFLWVAYPLVMLVVGLGIISFFELSGRKEQAN
jgi:hypothetical protein